jgi:signal transduction histidine kinase
VAGRSSGPLVSRLRVGQWFALAAGVLAVATIVSLALGVLAIARLAQARERVVDRIDPARIAALSLSNALINEETGVRGYALSARGQFLRPYQDGQRAEAAALSRLDRLARQLDSRSLTADVARVRQRAEAWRHTYAEPTLVAVRAFGERPSALADENGLARFDAVRAALAALGADLTRERTASRQRLGAAARFLTIAFAIIAGLLVLALVSVVVALRRIVTAPLAQLGGETRRVARGDFAHAVDAGGARDIVGLGRDVDSMRRRIVDELEAVREANAQLDRQATDLSRSNAELEQFAYVASHDLQEPLRKVASFTQLLQRRYEGQLDERADQYIHFASDGAVRMQRLINDLLAFSRVGRVIGEPALLDGGALVEDALGNLGALVEESRATVDVGPLPTVRGEASLLTAVFQNLIGNALKFRGEAPPGIAVSAEDDGDAWRFSVADNGIGIEAEYAERIFVIFQRLHPKESYVGTGIGLALCRKIVEFHGGRIWLDTEVETGATFRFTLPKPQEPTPT